MWRSLLYLSYACVGVFLQHMLQSLDTRHGWTQCSGGQPMQAGACVSVCVYVCHVDHVRSLRARLHSAEWFISSCSCGLDGYGGGGGSETAGQALRGCVCAHALPCMCVACVWMSEWLPQLIRSGSLWSWINPLALSLVWPCGLYGAPWRTFSNSRLKRK